ncbi:MAG: peptide chain release factor 3 [Burkholderiales bacterium]|nr:peptide chain release factor 3 [Phycisphaerae bacterium]
MSLNEEISRRRTFAIISHPDAGKTTLTEKLLLYGGAIQLAGSVTSRKQQRAVTSDWMELERQRGISVSSTVLQFEYRDMVVNLLDTPGHKDFSEDTYRVLTAVDSAVMVIDAAKGIEERTKKLFEVCRRRGIPIFTFMNKLDRPARDLLDLLDELERVLGIHAVPMNWPLGTGPDFKGIFDRRQQQVHLFERTKGGAYRAPVTVAGIGDQLVRDALDADTYQLTVDQLEMLDGAGSEFDPATFAAGKQTPVFFGSAVNNFGVQAFLDAFLDNAPPPTARIAGGQTVSPDHDEFTGFVFKIQANMDPRHRDRIAFVRIVSGTFERDMTARIVRTGKIIRLSSTHKLFGRDRETVDRAYPGDVLGVVGHADLRIGDTLAAADAVAGAFDEIPRFSPETFAYLHCVNTERTKQFREGLEQLSQEGVVQMLYRIDATSRVPLLAAVGVLQFDVVRFRLQSEYGVETRLEMASWQHLRWLANPADATALRSATLPSGTSLMVDQHQRPTLLFESNWGLKYFQTQFPAVLLVDVQSDVATAGVH